jgi:cysteinyl-tRNA synthetase
MIYIFNTLTKKIEELKPISPPDIGFYSCGPTVYDYAHIGHARTYVFNDILYRTLIFNGYKVKWVMNITDVGHLTSDADSGEDKMEKSAQRDKKSVWELAKFYTDDFFSMLVKLNINKPDIVCKATDYIPEMIELIKALETKGYTYKLADGIYFDTSKYTSYGKLTGRNLKDLKKNLIAGKRIEIVQGKKNITDFALWKFSPKDKNRQMEWDSPWGIGFPGWHIECSAMSMKFLGNYFDIHSGGVDHIAIHHSNEIAQSEAATDKPFVKYWLHGEHLLVQGEKMSKSLHNFYRVKDLEEKKLNPISLRYLFLTAHYRTQLNFTWEGIIAAQNAYTELKSQLITLKKEIHDKTRINISNEKIEKVDNFRNQFKEAVNNDLNTPIALAVLWKVLKSNIPPTDKLDLIYYFDEIMGLNLNKIEIEKTVNYDENVKKLVKEREEFRSLKDYKGADKIRKEIEKLGFIVEDTKFGPLVKPK